MCRDGASGAVRGCEIVERRKWLACLTQFFLAGQPSVIDALSGTVPATKFMPS